MLTIVGHPRVASILENFPDLSIKLVKTHSTRLNFDQSGDSSFLTMAMKSFPMEIEGYWFLRKGSLKSGDDCNFLPTSSRIRWGFTGFPHSLWGKLKMSRGFLVITLFWHIFPNIWPLRYRFPMSNVLDLHTDIDFGKFINWKTIIVGFP